MRIQHGEVFINGQALSEPYIRFAASYNYPADGTEAVVPAMAFPPVGLLALLLEAFARRPSQTNRPQIVHAARKKNCRAAEGIRETTRPAKR